MGCCAAAGTVVSAFFFFSSRRRHTRFDCDWSSDVCSSDVGLLLVEQSTEGADVVQRRISAQVAARREAMALQTPWDLTIGTAAYPDDGERFDELLQAADRRLYEQRGIELLEDPAGAWDDR